MSSFESQARKICTFSVMSRLDRPKFTVNLEIFVISSFFINCLNKTRMKKGNEIKVQEEINSKNAEVSEDYAVQRRCEYCFRVPHGNHDLIGLLFRCVAARRIISSISIDSVSLERAKRPLMT